MGGLSTRPAESYLFEKNIGYGTLRVISCEMDTLNNVASVRMEFVDFLGEMKERVIKITEFTDSELQYAVSFRIFDLSETELWRTDVAFNADEPLRLKILEASCSDALSMSVARDDGITTEIYQFNDKEFRFQYTERDFEYLKSRLRTPNAVFLKGTGPSLEDRQLELYEHAVVFKNSLPEIPTLFDNSDGALMTNVLTDYEFLRWLVLELNPDVEPLNMTIDDLCNIIGTGTTLKCLFAPGNPVCIIGTGASLACGGFYLVRWLYNSMES